MDNIALFVKYTLHTQPTLAISRLQEAYSNICEYVFFLQHTNKQIIPKKPHLNKRISFMRDLCKDQRLCERVNPESGHGNSPPSSLLGNV